MWWAYLLTFFGGAIVGAMLMALMAASRESEPHEVHVYCDEDGNMDIMTFPMEDKIVWHKKPGGIGGVTNGHRRDHRTGSGTDCHKVNV